ncbi:hypothetical protein HTIA_0304 [Halorhabdus tiamatea SARL4B]|uniref:Uncharacterized protein n=1 Tax=Halorhabdus tiamatea SARL4B TaxID=1033806 RepID=S6CS98_9EURY|nr:hypothetical protein HTIA_0304 [Halorhabdus tiamatea SARL4B]
MESHVPTGERRTLKSRFLLPFHTVPVAFAGTADTRWGR